MALTELARFLPRGTQQNRYLRSGMRPHHRDDGPDRHRYRDTATDTLGYESGPSVPAALDSGAASSVGQAIPTLRNDSIG
jgi:hypothetical protein